ncbi:kinase-like domain-containing protein [Cladochytrium replicatum]|nr:kinase-like domain-containing protein [Cladochytrium replicatum]
MVVVCQKWAVQEKLGGGSFGDVFGALDVVTGETVAIKREPSDRVPAYLYHEVNMYRHVTGAVGFPYIHYYGQEGNFNALVMERLGPSLKQLSQQSTTGRLPLRTVAYLVTQMVRRIEYVHSRNIVFRDVKPDQFCVGKHSDDIRLHPTIYLIDFGLADFYRNELGRHIRNKKANKNRPKTGTARYASLNVHRGKDHTRRDDLESLAYVVIELATGKLPWSGVQAISSLDGWRKVYNLKEEIIISDLCRDLPPEFAEFLEYTRSLQFSDDPDYNRIVHAFEDLQRRCSPDGANAPLEWDETRYLPEYTSSAPLPIMRHVATPSLNDVDDEERNPYSPASAGSASGAAANGQHRHSLHHAYNFVQTGTLVHPPSPPETSRSGVSPSPGPSSRSSSATPNQMRNGTPTPPPGMPSPQNRANSPAYATTPSRRSYHPTAHHHASHNRPSSPNYAFPHPHHTQQQPTSWITTSLSRQRSQPAHNEVQDDRRWSTAPQQQQLGRGYYYATASPRNSSYATEHHAHGGGYGFHHSAPLVQTGQGRKSLDEGTYRRHSQAPQQQQRTGSVQVEERRRWRGGQGGGWGSPGNQGGAWGSPPPTTTTAVAATPGSGWGGGWGGGVNSGSGGGSGWGRLMFHQRASSGSTGRG